MKKLFTLCIPALAASVFSLPALAEVAVVVNTKAAESSLTPIDQADSAAVRAEFYKKVADKDPAQAKALWSKLVFTGKATMPKEVADNAAVKAAVAANPKAIGYIDKSAVDATVKVVYTVQ